MKAWIHGLGAALIGGVLAGAANGLTTGNVTSKAGLIGIAVSAAVGGLTAAVAYLKQSPIEK